MYDVEPLRNKSMKILSPMVIFEHPPLDLKQRSIRVIEVLPYIPGRITICHMRITDLADEHIALSYVWGEDEPSTEIMIDKQFFVVRRNLAEFLEYASRYLPNRPLWIDAICINQKNISERNHQVRQMIDIYRSASFVLIWLGAEQGDVKQLCDAILSFDEELSLTLLRPSTSHECRKKYSGIYEKYADAVTLLLEANYWSRLWVIPEILSARKLSVACSKGCLYPWPCLMKALRVMSYQEFLSFKHIPRPVSSSKLALLSQTWRQNRSDYKLRDLLQDYGENQCSDPRDKVFALIALCSATSEVQIDYNISREDLYVNTLTTVGIGGDASVVYAKYLLDILQVKSATLVGLKLVQRLYMSPSKSAMQQLGLVQDLLRTLHIVVRSTQLEHLEAESFYFRVFTETIEEWPIDSAERLCRLFGMDTFDVQRKYPKFDTIVIEPPCKLLSHAGPSHHVKELISAAESWYTQQYFEMDAQPPGERADQSLVEPGSPWPKLSTHEVRRRCDVILECKLAIPQMLSILLKRHLLISAHPERYLNPRSEELLDGQTRTLARLLRSERHWGGEIPILENVLQRFDTHARTVSWKHTVHAIVMEILKIKGFEKFLGRATILSDSWNWAVIKYSCLYIVTIHIPGWSLLLKDRKHIVLGTFRVNDDDIYITPIHGLCMLTEIPDSNPVRWLIRGTPVSLIAFSELLDKPHLRSQVSDALGMAYGATSLGAKQVL